MIANIQVTTTIWTKNMSNSQVPYLSLPYPIYFNIEP